MNDYETMRAEFTEQLSTRLGLDKAWLEAAQQILDDVSSRYDITRKETSLVPVGDILPIEAKQYLVAKKVEGLSNLTLEGRRLQLVNFFKMIRKPVQAITSNDIRLYLYTYQKERHVSDRSLETMRCGVGAFFSWCFENNIVTRNVAQNIKPIKYERKQRTALNQYELEILRSACRTPRERAIIEFFYSTGCRCMELVGVKMSDIDLKEGTVTLYGKGKKERQGYLNAKCVLAIEQYLATRKYSGEYLFCSIKAPHDQITVHAVSRTLRVIAQRTHGQIHKEISPHILRHTTATHALRSGMPIEEIQVLLGHEDISTTRIYAEVNNQAVKAHHTQYII